MMKDKIRQVTDEEQRKYKDVTEDRPDTVKIGRFSFKVRWMKPYTLERLTDVSLNCKKEIEVPARTAALVLLNGFLKINLFYWLAWRVLYHCVRPEEIGEIIVTGKKKEESLIQEYLTSTILATVMRDSMMNMKREEVERFLQEQRSARHGQSGKNTPPS